PSCCPSSTHLAPPQAYTLSLHDALPISRGCEVHKLAINTRGAPQAPCRLLHAPRPRFCVSSPARCISTAAAYLADQCFRERHVLDRKSTRLNSSHVSISYAVFCLKKKKA